MFLNTGSLETCTNEVHLNELLHSSGIENEDNEYSETDEEIIDYYEEASDSEDDQDMDPNLQNLSTPIVKKLIYKYIYTFLIKDRKLCLTILV